MAQQFPTSAQVIYDTLVADATLMSLLGDYTFAGGQTFDAISIVSPGDSLPATRTVTGVECVIQDVGNVQAMDYVVGPSDMITSWQVFLIVWKPGKGSDMQAAAERILGKFGGSSSTQTVATSDGIGSLVQTKIVIRSSNPILA